MFINEYIMDHRRYEKWTVPKFYMLPIFYVYILVFIISAIGYWSFTKYGIAARWKTLAIVLMFIAVYRGVFVNWLKANKVYRLMKDKYYGGKCWKCRVEVDDKSILLYVNDTFNNEVRWNVIQKCCVAKSYIALRTEKFGEAVMLDNMSYIKGDVASFLDYMKTHHHDIPIIEEDPKYNR